MDIPNTNRMPGSRPAPEPVEKTFKLGRAAFIGLGVIGAGALFLGKKVSVPSLPSFNSSAGSVDGFTIYTITGGYPSFQAASYRLQIGGMVNHPLTMTIDDILRHPSVSETRFYQCVTGWAVPNT